SAPPRTVGAGTPRGSDRCFRSGSLHAVQGSTPIFGPALAPFGGDLNKTGGVVATTTLRHKPKDRRSALRMRRARPWAQPGSQAVPNVLPSAGNCWTGLRDWKTLGAGVRNPSRRSELVLSPSTLRLVGAAVFVASGWASGALAQPPSGAPTT